jgi:hypothetical protein
VLVATDVFVALAEAHATGLGARDVPILALQHPLGGIDGPAVEGRAADAFDNLVAILQQRADGS